MLAAIRKILVTSLVILIVLSMGAWTSNQAVPVKSQDTGSVEPPLYPGIPWSNQGGSTQDIRINVNGDTIPLAGDRYAAREQFPFQLPEEVLNYYSNEQLADLGWESYDSFAGPDGIHKIFYHESGVYLTVEFLQCQYVPTSICLVVWKSRPVEPATAAPVEATLEAAAASSFGKKSPADGVTNVNPTSTTFTWQAYSPTPDKYSYCVQTGSACDKSDPDWTSTYDTSVTLTGLAANTTYYWQVRAVTCISCTPKTFVYADGGDAWTFKTTQNSKATIVGNVGVGGATLSYTDGTAKTVTADATGAYSITVPLNWSGTVTPSKAGYSFTPKNASFTNLTAVQTIQNFVATVVYAISGNAGVAGATLSYTVGTPQTATSDGSGNYSIGVPTGWSGTVTPSKAGYVFSPVSRSYTNVTANQTAQNYAATYITYTISGNTGGLGGVTLTYTDGTPLFATSDGSGNYSFKVPMGWSGVVTPYETGYSFTPASTTYSNVQANQTQNYVPAVCPSCADKDTVGVFRPSNGLLYLKNENITGYADVSINYGIGGDYPVTGDWDGNGTSTIGVYRGGSFYLRNSNSVGFADITFPFGLPGDQPVAGDWNGDGVDTIGVYRSSTFTFYLRNSNSAGPADSIFQLGIPGDIGIAGDWTNKGFDTAGVFRPSSGVIFLKNTNATGSADIALNYGIPGDKPVTGDWDNNGTDTIGVLRGNVFYLRNSNTVGTANLTFALGIPGDMPIAGNWDAKP